ncbi:fimbrial biogenesis chaperone [Stenotrophomonas maltophilia]|uniref:fimbrial biogenesis chaperone n=1 Tax=Stenotrophomonas maltophilia TaxID=40324 RepID=UPI0009B0B13D|nr:fimbria/pilus periplasmic chaperone [Stenotrophomonas maltophilia]
MMRPIRSTLFCCVAVSTLMVAAPVDARLVVEGNRVIYTHGSKEVSVRVKNHGEVASLAQVWIDELDVDAGPDASKAPFVAMPPLMRIDGGKKQLIRVRYTGGDLPQDRESVFWLNVFDTPAVNPDASSAQIQIAVRNRFKLFYRPEALKNQNATGIISKLQWSLVQQGGRWTLNGRNDSPFHANAVKATLLVDGRGVDVPGVGMIAPFSTQQFALPGLSGSPGNAEVRLKFVTEYGSPSEYTAPAMIP